MRRMKSLSVSIIIVLMIFRLNPSLVEGSGPLIWYQENPDVTFSTHFLSRSLSIYDMNNDGMNDILISGETYSPNYGGFEIHLQRPYGSFLNTPDVQINTTAETTWQPTTSQDAGDFDNDGDMDVAGGGYNSGGRGWIYRQYAGFNFSFSQSLETSNPQIAETADFNGDGLADISIAEPTSGAIKIWLQKPNVGLTVACSQEICLWPDWPHYYILDYTIADLNYDGLADLLIVYQEREDSGNFTVDYKAFTTAIFYQPPGGWLNGGSFTQTLPDLILLRYPFSQQIMSTGIGIGDLNDDGSDDVALLTNEKYPGGNSLLVFLNNGTGISSSSSQTIHLSTRIYSLPHHFKDLNRDGMDDVLMGYPLRIHFQNSTHLVEESPRFISKQGGGGGLLAIADMDGDGDNDVVSAIGDVVSIYFTKLSTTMTCTALAREITEGGSLTISGSISPSVSDRMVTLTYKMPNGTTFVRKVATGADGSYNDPFKIDVIGSWNVMASWNGDVKYYNSSSSWSTFIVKEKPFFETPLGIASITAGIAVPVVVIAVLLVVKRKRLKTSS